MKRGSSIDDSDSNVVATKLKPRRIRKSSAGIRKIYHKWIDDEINRLITIVEQTRGLWDMSSPEYKSDKLEGWRSVVNLLGLDDVDTHEAKVKWSSLRTTYMVNMAKLRANPSYIVTWRFFNAMTFLAENGINLSTSSSPVVKLDCDENNSSNAEELSVPGPAVGKKFKRSRSQKPSPTRSPSPSPSPAPSAESSLDPISVLNGDCASVLNATDTNSTFCSNLLAELRTLSEPKARTLRYNISRLMMDYIEANQ